MRLNWSGLSAPAVVAALLGAGMAPGGLGAQARDGAATTGGQAPAPSASRPAAAGGGGAVARGQYLVNAAGCDDCHTPWKMGANGPEPDMTLRLSGHPAGMTLPKPPEPVGPWIMSATATNTGWAGPWGVSYTANLTPDPDTGIGKWTEQQFIDTIRTGRRQGRGREILPPMPWQAFKNYNDADLKAIFAYLKSLKAISNKVPEPALAAPPK